MHTVHPLRVNVWHFFGTPGNTPLIHQSEGRIGAEYYPGEDYGERPTPVSIIIEIAKTHIAQFRLSKPEWRIFKKMVDGAMRKERNEPGGISDLEPEQQN